MRTAYPASPERTLILALLLILAAGAWGLLIWQSADMRGHGMGGLTMGAGPPLFLAVWVAMMVAMMVPTAAPMILMFNRVHRDKRARGQSFVPTWVFVGAYLVVWTVFGAVGYVVASWVDTQAPQLMWLTDNASRVAAVLLVAAGVYQLSPLKNVCLKKCRSPVSFILNSWRDGYFGSFRMGIEHGAYCLGCCWLFFVLLFPLGLMNVAAMAVITLLIFAEKSLPVGQRVAQGAALVLVASGVAAMFIPGVLPTVMAPGPVTPPGPGMDLSPAMAPGMGGM